MPSHTPKEMAKRLKSLGKKKSGRKKKKKPLSRFGL